MRKLDGKDPPTWILQMEKFFDLNNVQNTQKVRMETLYLEPNQFVWYQWLPLAEWWYNTSFHTTTKMTPFMALSRYQPPSITAYLRENSKVQASKYHIEHQQQVLQILNDNLVLEQNRMKQQAYQHRSERSFDVGDWVFLWLKPYKCPSSKLRRIINYHQSIMVHTRCCKRLVLWHTN